MLYQLDFIGDYQEDDLMAVGFFTSPQKAREYAEAYLKVDHRTAYACDTYIHSVRIDPIFDPSTLDDEEDGPDDKGARYPEYEWYSNGARCDISRRLALRSLGLNF